MSSKQVIEEIAVNEGKDYTYKVVFDEDTSGLTLSARIRDASGSGTGTQVATASGDSAGTEVEFDLAISNESPGDYDLEIVDGSNEFFHPNPNEIIRLVIRDRFAVSN